jgi:hypothetical protein
MHKEVFIPTCNTGDYIVYMKLALQIRCSKMPLNSHYFKTLNYNTEKNLDLCDLIEIKYIFTALKLKYYTFVSKAEGPFYVHEKSTAQWGEYLQWEYSQLYSKISIPL